MGLLESDSFNLESFQYWETLNLSPEKDCSLSQTLVTFIHLEDSLRVRDFLENKFKEVLSSPESFKELTEALIGLKSVENILFKYNVLYLFKSSEIFELDKLIRQKIQQCIEEGRIPQLINVLEDLLQITQYTKLEKWIDDLSIYLGHPSSGHHEVLVPWTKILHVFSYEVLLSDKFRSYVNYQVTELFNLRNTIRNEKSAIMFIRESLELALIYFLGYGTPTKRIFFHFKQLKQPHLAKNVFDALTDKERDEIPKEIYQYFFNFQDDRQDNSLSEFDELMKEEVVNTQLISIPQKKDPKILSKELDEEVTYFIAKLRSNRAPIRWIIDTLLVSQHYYAAEEVLRRYGSEELAMSDEYFYQSIIYYRTNRLNEVIHLISPLLQSSSESIRMKIYYFHLLSESFTKLGKRKKAMKVNLLIKELRRKLV